MLDVAGLDIFCNKVRIGVVYLAAEGHSITASEVAWTR
jgi:hypothetical protein